MQFLRILFWVIVTVLVVVLASRNWHDVTFRLWGDLLLDIKLPVLLLLTFLAGFLPPFLILRARLWTVRRRLDSFDRQQTAANAAPAPVVVDEEPAK